MKTHILFHHRIKCLFFKRGWNSSKTDFVLTYHIPYHCQTTQLAATIQTVHSLTRKGIADTSRRTYNSGLNTVKQFFCWLSKETGHASFVVNESLLRVFVAYVYNHKVVKDNTVAGYLTAFRSFLIDNGIPFTRFDMPVLKRELIGYAFSRGSKPDTREPIGVFNGKLMELLNSVDPSTYMGRLKRLCFLMQHKPLLRTEETGLAHKHYDRILKVQNFKWYPSFEEATDVIVSKTSSKTDRLGRRQQNVPVTCECPGPCLVCTLKEWLVSLAVRAGGYLAPDAVVLQKEDGSPVTAANIRHWFGEQCEVLNWDRKTHKPYSLKIGRAGDLYILGLPCLTIMDIGCWRSPCFMRYIRPHERDNLFLLKKKTSKCSLTTLAKQNVKFQIYTGGDKARTYQASGITKNTKYGAKSQYFLFKAANGLFQPCLGLLQHNGKYSITILACGSQMVVSKRKITPYKESLANKPYKHCVDGEYVNYLNSIFS